jgi:hypothetical protein
MNDTHNQLIVGQLKLLNETLKGTNKILTRLLGVFEAKTIVETLKGEEQQFTKEKLDATTTVVEEAMMTWEMEHEGKNYKTFKPCKYKCGFWSGWGKPYNKGDKILHINPATKEIIGFNCPKFKEE